MSPGANIDPRALISMAGYIRDTSKRMQANHAAAVQKAQQTIEKLRKEITLRQRYLAQTEHEYERNRQDGRSDCSDDYQRLQHAALLLDRAKRALRSAEDALRQFRAAESRLERRTLQVADAGVKTLKRLKNHLDTYEAFAPLRGLTAIPGSGSGTRLSARSLSHTAQTWRTITRKGRELQIFDHPVRSAGNAVIRQGSARPDSFRGTCGLCASGSILRKAGLDWDEGRMIDLAVSLGQCTTGRDRDNNGGTCALNLVSLLEKAGGVASQCGVGGTLTELAGSVEAGQGVIIGVNASLLNPARYGSYDPNNDCGHWVELASVVRDAKSNKIVGFVVTDSNGEDPRSACQLISASRLKRAFEDNGAVSVVTNQIIW